MEIRTELKIKMYFYSRCKCLKWINCSQKFYPGIIIILNLPILHVDIFKSECYDLYIDDSVDMHMCV